MIFGHHCGTRLHVASSHQRRGLTPALIHPFTHLLSPHRSKYSGPPASAHTAADRIQAITYSTAMSSGVLILQESLTVPKPPPYRAWALPTHAQTSGVYRAHIDFAWRSFITVPPPEKRYSPRMHGPRKPSLPTSTLYAFTGLVCLYHKQGRLSSIKTAHDAELRKKSDQSPRECEL